MEMEKQTFRSAVGGYNKQDVNEYIASLSESFAREKEDYEKKLDDMIELVESLRAKCAEKPEPEAPVSAEDAPDTTAELERANSLISEQTQKLEAKEEEIASLKARLSESEQSAAELRERLAGFDDCAEKLRDYDRMSQKMGELMLKAASDAEKLREDARAQAESTLRESEERAKEITAREEEMSKELEKRYADAVDAINRKLAELVNDGFARLDESMKSADEELASLLERRRSEARAAVLKTAESLPELEALADIGDGK